MVAYPRSLTPEEFLALPEPDDGPSLEYLNGEVRQKVAPKRKHVTIGAYLNHLLYDYARETGGFSGPEPTTAFVSRGDTRYLVPDLAYWAPGKPQGDDVFLPPTLAIETRSPEESPGSLREKCRYYVANGVDIAWFIYAENLSVEAFEDQTERTYGPGDTVESRYLPGLSLSIDELFATLER